MIRHRFQVDASEAVTQVDTGLSPASLHRLQVVPQAGQGFIGYEDRITWRGHQRIPCLVIRTCLRIFAQPNQREGRGASQDRCRPLDYLNFVNTLLGPIYSFGFVSASACENIAVLIFSCAEITGQ